MGEPAPLPPPLARTLPIWARAAIAAVALGLWTISVFEHEYGGKLFYALFMWGKSTWGDDGAARIERLIFVAGLVMASVVAVATAVRALRAVGGRAAAPELAARWVAWFLFAYAANRFTICLQSEDVHFAQYGFVSFCIALVTGQPRAGFLAATFLGFLDESNQWWRMYYNDWDNHLDWNDMILNACGACAGALPFTCFARIRTYAAGKEDQSEPGSWAFGLGIAAALAAIVGLLYSKNDFGHYPAWPFWTELDNRKAFHVLTLEEGLPALLGIAYVLYYVVDERRRGLPFRALVGAMLALHLGVTPPRSDRELPVHEVIPAPARIPRAKKPPKIDGKLDPEEWAGAAVLTLHPFASLSDVPEGMKTDDTRMEKLGPELPTKALVQWDDQALYVGFDCASEDVWARDLQRDEPSLPGDSCVEVFLDVDAAERTYYEFEVSPANRVQDLFVYWPASPSWWPSASTKFVNLNGWDSKHLQTAVQVKGGECELLPEKDTENKPRKLAKTQGYSVELAIPWGDLKGRAIPPHAGARLRANFYRVEIPRPRVQDAGSYLSWAPTRFPLDFHRPQFFGVLELGD
jgi:hypothetical protein